jgi:hypothetical protein
LSTHDDDEVEQSSCGRWRRRTAGKWRRRTRIRRPRDRVDGAQSAVDEAPPRHRRLLRLLLPCGRSITTPKARAEAEHGEDTAAEAGRRGKGGGSGGGRGGEVDEREWGIGDGGSKKRIERRYFQVREKGRLQLLAARRARCTAGSLTIHSPLFIAGRGGCGCA